MNENYEENIDYFDDDDFEVEDKKTFMDGVKSFGKKTLGGLKQFGKTIVEHPDEALAGAGVVALTVLTIASGKKAEKTVYSADIGETVQLKKKLTNDNKVAIDHLMKEEDLTKIQAMEKLGLIK